MWAFVGVKGVSFHLTNIKQFTEFTGKKQTFEVPARKLRALDPSRHERVHMCLPTASARPVGGVWCTMPEIHRHWSQNRYRTAFMWALPSATVKSSGLHGGMVVHLSLAMKLTIMFDGVDRDALEQ